jgi:hypothetical protein
MRRPLKMQFHIPTSTLPVKTQGPGIFSIALRHASAGIALAILAIVPFLNKAHTIDDGYYLEEARHALVDPLHPTAFDIVWSAEILTRVSSQVAVGPGVAWLFLPVVALHGSEWLAHSIQLLLLSAGTIATAALGLRIGLTGRQAGIAAFLTAATAPVLVMAGTSMPDVPAMVFGVLAMERIAAWSQESRWQQGLAAAVYLALAFILRTHMIGLAGVAALWTIDWRDRTRAGVLRQLRGLAPVLGAIALTWMIVRVSADPFPGGGTLAAAVQASASTDWLQLHGNARSFLVNWTILMPLALPWLILRFRRFGAWTAFLGVAAMCIFRILQPDRGRWHLIALALSSIALISIVWDAWRSRDRIRLALAAWLFLSAPVILYSHLPSKYLVASAPAAAILVASLVDRARVGKLRAAACCAVVAAQVVLAVLILKADSDMSGAARQAAVELIRPRIQQGRRVWFDGQWGFHWYATQEGALPLSINGPKPVSGDIIVRSAISDPICQVMPLIPHLKLLTVVHHATPGGRIMSSGAGFYRNRLGMLPWVWAGDDDNRFEVWEVE